MPPQNATAGLSERWHAKSPGRSRAKVFALSKSKGAGRQGPARNVFRMPVAWRPARFFVRLLLQAPVRSDTARRRPFWQAAMQPHCARLVVAGRRRDRDDPRALRARAPSSVEADARAMDHRAHVAGPPPLRQPVPVITAAPSVEGVEAEEHG